MKAKIFCTLVFTFCLCSIHAQSVQKDSLVLKQLFNEALDKGKSYDMLRYLCKNIGSRLSGSAQAARAVEYTRLTMQEFGFDTVYLQELMVPHWVRGEKEKGIIRLGKKQIAVQVCALGNAVGTGKNGIEAGVVEVKSLKELELLGKEAINGKIVFYNRPMDSKQLITFSAYGGAVDQRSSGAIEAARYGALGVLVRSMSLSVDHHPHTGALRYDEAVPKIPALAISTADADLLSAELKKQAALKFFMQSNCQMLPDEKSYNVIGEIWGAEKKDEIIAVGGHLDSWDVGEGAHDDGAGCVQSIEALRLFKAMGIRPKRTLRCIMFMNEENGLRGGLKYAELALTDGRKHLAAIETDRGGFSPRGFSIDAEKLVLDKVRSWSPLLWPYLLDHVEPGGGGADIGPLKKQGVPLIGFVPDSQRYFDFHHADTDVLEAVNKRELELGAASIAALMWLISEYGL